MIFQPIIGAELPGNYCPQGFHPVHLDDTFANGRYIVKHKLGHGMSSTTWLVQDLRRKQYAALKIVAAAQSPGCQLDVLKHLQTTYDGNEDGSRYVMQMLDHFEHSGPNGRHLGIVSEVLGPNLASDIEEFWANEIFPPDVAKRLVAQIGLGVKYLHRRNIAHGGQPFIYFSSHFKRLLTRVEWDRSPPRQYVVFHSADGCMVCIGC